MLDIGLLGCGTIGSGVAEAVAAGRVPDARLAALHNRTTATADDLAAELDAGAQVVEDPVALADHADVVVEAASHDAVREAAAPILESGTDMVVLSVGAFGDPDLFATAREAADEGGARIHVPSGALAGLDAVSAAGGESVDSVSLTTTRPPEKLKGTAYVEDLDVDLDGLSEDRTVFDGTAREAVAAFPEHINVAMALSLAAGVDPGDVRVRIVASPDPETPYSVQRVRLSGDTGTIEAEARNHEIPGGGASWLVVSSTVEKLRGLTATLDVGS